MNLFITKNYLSMKRILKFTAVVFAILLGSVLQNKASAQYSPDDDVSYQNFYDELSPYGNWIEYPGYGYVWQPEMGDDFRPYSSGGQWVWNDDYEWMWVSDYDWGWAPFHYGRWFEDDYYGWLWQPGYEWSPAWVAWRDGGDYYGWAPLRPGINISINFNLGSYNPPNSYWCFAPRRYITSRNIFSYCLDRRQNVTIIHNTTIINNYNYGRNVFRTGPRRYEAERYCGTIRPVSFRQSYTPGRSHFRNNEVSVYRPNIRRDDNRNHSPRQFNRYDRQGSGNRIERNGSDFRRNDNNRRNNDVNGRGNNLPARMERSNNEVRPSQNNGSNDRRRFDRTDNNNDRQPNRNNDIRAPRQMERPNDNANNSNDRRRFDRTDNNDGRQPNRNNDIRAPRQTERPNDNTNNPNGSTDRRRFDRNDNNGQQTNRNNEVRQPREMERRDMNAGNNNRQTGNEVRRNENRPQPQPQRQYSPQPEQRRMQEQPRQQERGGYDNGNRQHSGSNSSAEGNRGNRGGNGRRF